MKQTVTNKRTKCFVCGDDAVRRRLWRYVARLDRAMGGSGEAAAAGGVRRIRAKKKRKRKRMHTTTQHTHITNHNHIHIVYWYTTNRNHHVLSCFKFDYFIFSPPDEKKKKKRARFETPVASSIESRANTRRVSVNGRETLCRRLRVPAAGPCLFNTCTIKRRLHSSFFTVHTANEKPRISLGHALR